RAPDVLVCPLPLHEKLLTPVGSGSLTETFVAVLGPELESTIVYVVVLPGTTLVTPSVLVTPTLFWGVKVSVSLMVLLPVFVSLAAAMVTVLMMEPVAEALIVAMTV